MIKNKNIDRYVVVIVGICVVATSGVVGGLLAAENDLKDYLKIQQKEGTIKGRTDMLKKMGKQLYTR